MKHAVFSFALAVAFGMIHLLARTPAFAVTLDVLFTGTGGGAVVSSPPGIACIAPPCTHDFPGGTAVTLYAVPESISIFTGWGGPCSGAAPCAFTLNAPTTVTAGFDLSPPVQISGPTPAYFATVMAGVAAAPDHGRIQLISGERTESVTLNRDVSLSLEGGYDAGFSGSSGLSTLRGTFTVARGALTAGNIALSSDTTPPAVLLTVPAHNATGLSADIPCTVVFSKAMDPATVTPTNFFLQDNAGRPVAAAVTAQDTVAVLTPVAPLAAGTTFTATLRTGVADLAGNGLAQDFVWSFAAAPALANGTLAQAVQPANLLEKNGWLFWSESGDVSLRRVPSSGGVPIPLAWNYGTPAALALYGMDLYWLTTGGSVYRTPLDGGLTERLASGPNGIGITSDLLVDGTGVYWVATTSSPDTYTIMTVPRTGGPAAGLYSTTTPIFALQRDSTSIYWLEQLYPNPPGSPPPQLKKMPLAGGPVTTVYTSPSLPLMRSSIALLGTDLVFAEEGFPNSYRILKVSAGGGPATELAAYQAPDAFTPKKLVLRIVADDNSAYWLDSDSLRSAPLAGGGGTVLVTGFSYPQDLAVDAGRVYWTETTGPAHGETGAVKSVPKGGGATVTRPPGRCTR